MRFKVIMKTSNGIHEILAMEGGTLLGAIRNIKNEDISNDIYRRADERLVNATSADGIEEGQYQYNVEEYLEDAFSDYLAGNGYTLSTMVIRVTDLDTHEDYYANDDGEAFIHIYNITGDEELSDEMSAWADTAQDGEQWIKENVDVMIEST